MSFKFLKVRIAPDHILIPVPRRLDTFSALAFLEELQDIPESNQYVFDFQNTNFCKPSGMLIAASGIRRFVNARRDAEIRASNFQQLTYAGEMGFFKRIGLGWGKEPGEAHGNESYQPIRTLSIDEIKKRANKSWTDIGDIVDGDARKLATILSRQDKGPVADTLTFAIREIIRNVVEHSLAQEVIYSAQFWPKNGIVEIAVADEGIGLKQSLSQNPTLDIRSEDDALKLAVLPGISGVNWSGKARTGARGDWENSGYGLFMTSRLCSDRGTFTIGSGTSSLQIRGGKRETRGTQIVGTAVCMEIDTTKLTDTQSLLAAYSREGSALAKQMKDLSTVEPSSASTMLSEYFKKK